MRSKSSMAFILTLVFLAAPAPAHAEEKISGAQAEQVRQAIADYIERDLKLKGGFFLYDPELKRVVGLRFDSVHEGVTRTAEGRYFACVDMRSVRGPLYDLDIYVEQTEEGLRPAKLVIHKVDGKKREKPAAH